MAFYVAYEAVLLLTLSLADFLCPTGTVLPGLTAAFYTSNQLLSPLRPWIKDPTKTGSSRSFVLGKLIYQLITQKVLSTCYVQKIVTDAGGGKAYENEYVSLFFFFFGCSG